MTGGNHGLAGFRHKRGSTLTGLPADHAEVEIGARARFAGETAQQITELPLWMVRPRLRRFQRR
jgi:hypothetical protein